MMRAYLRCTDQAMEERGSYAAALLSSWPADGSASEEQRRLG